jgi:alpha-galactosidase
MLRTHYVPALRGQPRRPLVTVNTCFTHHGTGHFLHEADAENIGALVEPFGRLGAELMIIDAGWYPCGENYHQIRDLWPLDPERYPRGLRPLADRCRAAGLDLGLWYSPEWGYDSMPVVQAHPEWADANGRLRLERPEPRDWFLGEVERMADEGITCYRQDWYMTYEDPEPDRQGIVELTHFEGLYAMWDELRRRHPDWVMEGCCGGGRRIDLETLARFHWHQKSDRWFDVESDQCSLHGANLFLPGGLINIPTQGTSDYETWSSFAGQFSLGWHPLDAEFPHEQAAAQVALYKRVRDRLDGDFYPLTPCALDAPWLGFQFHDPDTDHGLVLVFRRPNAEAETCTVRLRGLAPDRTYAIAYANGDETTATGARLAAGLEVRIPAAPGANLIEVG